MPGSEKFGFVHCHQCGKENRLNIDPDQSGHYQCGHCSEYLMYYGVQPKTKSKYWVWALCLVIPIGYLGYTNLPDENNWTPKNIQKFEKTCKAQLIQKTNWTIADIEDHCQCLTDNLIKYDFKKVIGSTAYYTQRSKEACQK